MKRMTLVILFILGLFQLGTAQSGKEAYEAWKAEIRKQFELAKDGQRSVFEAHRTQNDSIFLGFLRGSWSEMSITAAHTSSKSAPVKPIVYSDEATPDPESEVKQIEVTHTEKLEISHPYLDAKSALPIYTEVNLPKVSVQYLGQTVSARLPKEFGQKLPKTFSHTDIANFWVSMSKANYQVFISDLLRQKQEKHLSDWMYHQVLGEYAKQLYAQNPNGQALFKWFSLWQSGYLSKVGTTAEGNVVLMLAFQQKVYGQRYYSFNSTKFYLMDAPKGVKLKSYRDRTTELQIPLNLEMKEAMVLGGSVGAREVAFSFAGKPYHFLFEYNQHYANYYQSMPAIGVEWNFQSRPSANLQASIIREIKPVVSQMTEREAGAFLLAMVQKGFPYQDDAEQFGEGEEKYFFLDEMFHYPYSDCEDRAVLYAYLVKELLSLEVLGLDYPGHVATSVAFTEPLYGDYIEYEGKKFTICDPTFINAPIGKTMPNLRGVGARVILTANR